MELNFENSQLLYAVTIFSFITIIVSPIISATIILSLPKDYLLKEDSDYPPSFFRFILSLVRNLLGAIFFLLGILLLFLPGQGILTIVASLLIMEFKVKRKILRKGLSSTRAFDAVNSLRTKLGRAPLQHPERTSTHYELRER